LFDAAVNELWLFELLLRLFELKSDGTIAAVAVNDVTAFDIVYLCMQYFCKLIIKK
jgi:hypothetical protein